MEYEIDSLDRDILRLLRDDARRPFLEVARQLGVSGGTIHQRVARLKKTGVITGSRLAIDYRLLGFNVAAFVGIQLTQANASAEVQRRLLEIPEIVEIHYTTGKYSLLARVTAHSVDDLYRLLSGELQSSPDIQSTETFVILDTAVEREAAL
ncbi:MAG: Lrp/AsnC ligand binding domain-containing protein [bacterium]